MSEVTGSRMRRENMSEFQRLRDEVPDGVATVTFTWNDVAIATMLLALKERYPAGYISMLDHVREGVATQ